MIFICKELSVRKRKAFFKKLQTLGVHIDRLEQKDILDPKRFPYLCYNEDMFFTGSFIENEDVEVSVAELLSIIQLSSL